MNLEMQHKDPVSCMQAGSVRIGLQERQIRCRQASAAQRLPSIVSSCWVQEKWKSRRHARQVNIWPSSCDGARTMNTTYRWELKVNPRRRLENSRRVQDASGGNRAEERNQNLSFSIDAPTYTTTNCGRAQSLAGWDISVEYTMILARISTRRPTHQQPGQRLSCCVLHPTPNEQSNTC